MRIILIGVFVFVSFFRRFLVFQLLSILYFTLLNSDLRLKQRCFETKQRSVALGNMPLTLTCFNQGINTKACEVYGR